MKTEAGLIDGIVHVAHMQSGGGSWVELSMGTVPQRDAMTFHRDLLRY